MPRQSIEDLGSPPAGFRVDLRTDDPSGVVKLETGQRCSSDDAGRVRRLQAFVASGKPDRKRRRQVKRLVRFLSNDPGKSRRLSAASRVLMREWRIRVCGWLWALIDPLGTDEWVFFTIIPPSWWVKSSQLEGVSAKKMLERLRRALDRAGSGEASGWLYAVIHAEFDGATGGVPFHVHGLATQGMMKVLRDLRKQRQFRSNDTDAARFPHISVRRKVKIDQPHGYLPMVITYASKSFWPQHDSRIDDGKRRRVGLKHRIKKAKDFVRCLLWTHAQRVKDQVLLVHLSVANGELVPGKRGVRDSH